MEYKNQNSFVGKKVVPVPKFVPQNLVEVSGQLLTSAALQATHIGFIIK